MLQRMLPANRLAGVPVATPSCILRVQGKARFAKPSAPRSSHVVRAGSSEPQLLDKTESPDGETVFTFGSASEKPAASKQSAPAASSSPAPSNSNGSKSETPKPASTSPPPAPEKKIRPPPKDGNYAGYEMEELREYAKQRGMSGYQKLRKQALIDTLKRNERWKVTH